MLLKVIACEVAAREIYHCAAECPHSVNLTMLHQGLHDEPENCRATLQAELDKADAEEYDAVLLGYGLCNNSTVGLRAGKRRVIIPRAHDCITFFLGSKEHYAKLFDETPGTYYFTAGWLEFGGRDEEGRKIFAQDSHLAREQALQELREKYGEENADFLMQTMSNWEVNYSRGALITFPFTARLGLEAEVRRICSEREWSYRELAGDISLLRDWLDGNWDTERFLILQPGQEVAASHDERVLKATIPRV